MATPPALNALRFRVFGQVQRVFFRKYTAMEANRLALKGHVMNQQDGSVSGLAVGTPPALDDFKAWLSTVGSPKSKIDRAEFESIPVTPDLLTSLTDPTKFVIVRHDGSIKPAT
ncbi:hypothetical protein AMAG_00380 [Allomyces macrogynus ATCC 38327]|uniref:acylphosphatase n=1 Tax=Allomyces macrogynus (strain ATCC 38327) TaxID=578462 RepID=A0A0L0RWF5_ALLM3|nr:hypothetical protein AMAG_00380 [Allomyces macrogynus ATCC 38327]|eukprot:KNE54406.1 hypothetical protein AMAG_00380 [Allomyces macrogynus ATCC 38327]